MRHCLPLWRKISSGVGNGNTRNLFLILLTLLSSQIIFAQGTVRGKVTSADSALANVTVQVKGTSTSTQTDEGGNFSINASPNATLVLSAIGFGSQEVKINNRTTIAVQMQGAAQQMNEVVVVGYGTQRRGNVTGAVSSISAAQIEKVPVTNVGQSLQGRAAGVQVTNNDGAPGGNVSILIRGVGSLANGGNNPLFIVDGYPITGGINNLNPNDIASIDVLKDASSTSIYGVRAANGVVVITTKRGRKNSVQVALDAYNSVQTEPKKYKVLSAQDWAKLANEVADADPQRNFQGLPIWRTPAALTNIDWQDELYRKGLTQNYSVGIRGGSDKAQSAISLGYYNQKGIVEGSYFKRFTASLNLDYQPTNWLKSVTSAKYAYSDQNNPFGTGSLVQLTQLPPTMDSGNKSTSQIKDANGNYGFYNPNNTYVAKYSNPLYAIQNNQYQNISNFFLVNSALEGTILKGLRIKTNAGVNVNNYNGSYFQPEDNRINQQYNLGGATQNPLFSQNQNQSFEWLWENTLAYDRTFGNHTVNFVGGVSWQKTTYNAMGGSGIPPNSVVRDLSRLRNLSLNSSGQVIYTLASQFGRLNYNYADKYMVSGILRRDGSSKFGENNRYGVFPSASVAWKAKSESFLSGVTWLNDLKFRGGYGLVGNEQTIQPFQYEALYSTGLPATQSGNLGYPFGKVFQSGVAQTQPANPDLKWETDYSTNIGVDAAFMRGALTVTIDWFNRRSKDFLLYIPVPAQTGYQFKTMNVGEMVNKGIEVALGYRHGTGEFQYGVNLTAGTYKNTLTSLISGTNAVGNLGSVRPAGNGWDDYVRTFVGGSVGEFFGYKSLGIFQTQQQIDALNAAAKAKNSTFDAYQRAGNTPGDRYFADANGDGHVTAEDRVSIGSPLPKVYGGLNLDANYGNFDFNLFFNYSIGNKILNYQKSSLQSFQNRSFVGVQNVSYDYFVNRWTPTNPSNTYGRATYNDDAIGSNVPSDAWVEDGSFARLKNLIIGYTLPNNSLGKVAFSKLRVYVSTQNVFTITKYSGLDPEIGMQGGSATQNGIDNGTYPMSRFFTFGINATF
jgi:TonB-linked SusC/RagA family outer membrane protein